MPGNGPDNPEPVLPKHAGFISRWVSVNLTKKPDKYKEASCLRKQKRCARKFMKHFLETWKKTKWTTKMNNGTFLFSCWRVNELSFSLFQVCVQG